MESNLHDTNKRIKELEIENQKLREQLNFHSSVGTTTIRLDKDKLLLQCEILEKLAQGVIIIKAIDGIILYSNHVLESMFGYNSGELIGKHVSILNAPTDRRSPEEIAKEVIQSLVENSSWNGEVQNIRKNGTLFWSHANITAFKHEEYGKVWISIHKDITGRKQALKALQIQRRELQDILDSVPAWIFYKDTKNRFLRVNKAFADVMGTSKELLEGKNLFELYPQEEALAYWKDDLEVFESGIPKKNIVETMSFQGKTIWVKTDKIPYYDEDNRIIGIIGFAIDMSQSKLDEIALLESKEKLNELNETKDKFFSIIAHDLKSPFTGFMGIAKILAEDTQNLSNEEIKELAVLLKASSNNLYKLLSNLLDWSRMQRGVFDFVPENQQLFFHVKNNFEIVKTKLDLKGLTMKINVTEDIFVYADGQMLNGILRNLISNAIKFTNKGGQIVVEAKDSVGMVQISVSDNGIGMEKDMMQKIFSIGEKTSRAGTDGELSTGLGLILCKEFVEKHGGRIWVESEVGYGSSFTFTLPKINK